MAFNYLTGKFENDENDNSSQDLLKQLLSGVGDPNNIPQESIKEQRDRKQQELIDAAKADKLIPILSESEQQDIHDMTHPEKSQINGVPFYLSKDTTPLATANPELNKILMAGLPGGGPASDSLPIEKQQIPEQLKGKGPLLEKQIEEIKSDDIEEKPKALKTSPKTVQNKSEEKKENKQEESKQVETQVEGKKGPDLSIDELKKGMEIARQNQRNLINRLHDYSLVNIAAGKPFVPVDDIKMQIQLEDQQVKDYETLLEAKRQEEDHSVKMSKSLMELGDEKAMTNANSDISKASRSILRQMAQESKMDLDIPDNVPYSQLKLMFPSVEKYLQAKENADTRKEIAAGNRMNKELAINEQRQKFDDRRFDQANKVIQSEISGNRSAFGRNANIVRSAQALEQLVSGYNNLNDLDNRQIQEIAKGLDAMLSAGAATITGTQKLVPHTASGDISKISEYINGIPKGAEQGKFVKRMLDTIKREKLQASKNIITTQQKLLASYQDLKQRYPDRWDAMMEVNELPTNIKDKSKQEDLEKQQDTLKDEKKSNLVRVKSPDGKVFELDADKAEQLVNKYNYTRM